MGAPYRYRLHELLCLTKMSKRRPSQPTFAATAHARTLRRTRASTSQQDKSESQSHTLKRPQSAAMTAAACASAAVAAAAGTGRSGSGRPGMSDIDSGTRRRQSQLGRTNHRVSRSRAGSQPDAAERSSISGTRRGQHATTNERKLSRAPINTRRLDKNHGRKQTCTHDQGSVKPQTLTPIN